MNGHAVRVARLSAVSERLEYVSFAVVELFGHKADAGQCVQGTADAARLAILATAFETLLCVLNGLHIVRHAEIEQPH